MEEYICNTIGPRIRGDGGWVEFVSYEDRCLTLIFRGECSKCIILNRCLDWIRQEIHLQKTIFLGSLIPFTERRSHGFC